MNLSRFDASDDAELSKKYRTLREQLHRLSAAPVKDMTAIDAVLVELDEVQAGLKQKQRLDSDPQRF